MRLFTLVVLLSIFCFGRDNPFVPIEDITKFTQKVQRDKYFKKTNFTLPDSARVLKKIDVYYQNLDGSISRKTISVDQKIDWHNRFILTYGQKSVGRKKVSKAASSALKKSGSSLGHGGVKSFKYKNFISFRVEKNRIEIFTKDKKIRDFMVDKPYKVVVDFRRDTNFLTKSFKVNLPPFVSVVLGNHEGYYRAAIELDGQYVYKIEKSKGGYIVTLR